MSFKDVERRVRSDHRVLRALLGRIEELADRVLAGARLPEGSLRAEGHLLLEQLSRHMRWEDDFLIPVLRRTEGFGEVYAGRLQRDHAEQRELLEYELTLLHDASRPIAMVARNLADLAALLCEDMAEEERVFLSPVDTVHREVRGFGYERKLP